MRPSRPNTGLPAVAVQVFGNKDGSYVCKYTPVAEGDYVISVKLDGADVRGTPARLTCRRAASGARSWAAGPGLAIGLQHRVNKFTLHVRGDNDKAVSGIKHEVLQRTSIYF